MRRRTGTALVGTVALAVGLAAAGSGHSDPIEGYEAVAAPEGSPLSENISGYYFRTPETRALQDDDFENPGFLWVDQGAELWETAEGEAGKACSDCHDDASVSMATAGAHFPKWNEDLQKPVNLEMQINLCRENNMQAEPWKYESQELLAMTTFVRHQSRGEPVQVDVSGPMAEWKDRGEAFYYGRRGQLDMACANCHEDYSGVYIRADHLSQGQSNGFPTYRLKWQGIGSLHRRFRGCNEQVRATKLGYGHDDYTALEVYLAWRGSNLPVETPAVRQ